MVPNLPFPWGVLIKETLLLDSFYQNVWVFKCQQLSIDCEALYFLEELRQQTSYCLQHSLLNGNMMVRRMLFLLLNWTVLWEIHRNHILHHHVIHCITPKTRLEVEALGEIIDITSHFCNALYSKISKHQFKGNQLNFTTYFLENILSPLSSSEKALTCRCLAEFTMACGYNQGRFVGWGNIFY